MDRQEVQKKCSERACPYFAVPGETLCRYHLTAFAYAGSDEPDETAEDHRFTDLDKDSEIRDAIFQGDISQDRPGSTPLELDEKREAERFQKTILRLRGKKA